MQLEYIDVLQCESPSAFTSRRVADLLFSGHRFDPTTPIEETVRISVVQPVASETNLVDVDAGSSRCRTGGICSVYRDELVLGLPVYVARTSR